MGLQVRFSIDSAAVTLQAPFTVGRAVIICIRAETISDLLPSTDGGWQKKHKPPCCQRSQKRVPTNPGV